MKQKVASTRAEDTDSWSSGTFGRLNGAGSSELCEWAGARRLGSFGAAGRDITGEPVEARWGRADGRDEARLLTEGSDGRRNGDRDTEFCTERLRRAILLVLAQSWAEKRRPDRGGQIRIVRQLRSDG
jgi:hypothetical protein